jgi:hypothetical protein
MEPFLRSGYIVGYREVGQKRSSRNSEMGWQLTAPRFPEAVFGSGTISV